MRKRTSRPGVAWLVWIALSLLLAWPLRAHADAPPPDQRGETLHPDRSTPRRSLEGFLRASQANDTARAAQFLDLRAIAPAQRTHEGAALARRLFLVLGWTVVIDPATVSNDPDGDPSDGPDCDVIASIPLDDDVVPISLTRSRAPDGASTWLVSRATVAMVPALYASYGARWIGENVPAPLSRYRLFDLALWQWLGLVLSVVLGYGIGLLGGAVLLAVGDRIAKRTRVTWDDEIVHAARGPARLAIGVVGFERLTEILHLTAAARTVVERLWSTLLILAAAWFLQRLIRVGATTLEGSLPEESVGDVRVRGIRTRVSVLRRIASILVGVLAAAAILMQFDIVRSFGMSLLASAGIAGVVVGFAAQRSLAGVIAGIHLSVTQPVRIDDAVVFEGQFGTIEEINLTYVVVRVWDGRRLIVPIGRFLEAPFENWTRTTPELLGQVQLQVDYTTPIEPLRAELARLCREHPAWDGRACRLQVTDASERTITVRAIVSAANADKAWDLRCAVREGLLQYLQRLENGAHLPKLRVVPS